MDGDATERNRLDSEARRISAEIAADMGIVLARQVERRSIRTIQARPWRSPRKGQFKIKVQVFITIIFKEVKEKQEEEAGQALPLHPLREKSR